MIRDAVKRPQDGLPMPASVRSAKDAASAEAPAAQDAAEQGTEA